MTDLESQQTPDPTSADASAVVVPDKPALEGLESKWAEQWKSDDTYGFDRTQPRENVYSIDTPPPDRAAAACTWATSSPTRTPT